MVSLGREPGRLHFKKGEEFDEVAVFHAVLVFRAGHFRFLLAHKLSAMCAGTADLRSAVHAVGRIFTHGDVETPVQPFSRPMVGTTGPAFRRITHSSRALPSAATHARHRRLGRRRPRTGHVEIIDISAG